MAIAMSLHFFGYEYARSGTLTLFTSSKTGFASPATLPFALACVFPCSFLLLNIYTTTLQAVGPRNALRLSAITCSITLALLTIAIHLLSKTAHTKATLFLTGVLFVFREAYVQLLSTQHWSFMGSIMTTTQGATWFGPIAGFSSASSAVAGLTISRVVTAFGVHGLVGMACVSLLASLFFAENAYEIAKANGFCPGEDKRKTPPKKKTGEAPPRASTLHKATSLFARVPVLKSLFIETLLSQGLSTILNVSFVSFLRIYFQADADRAVFMGKFYAAANICSGLCQFVIMPNLMPYANQKYIWMFMPLTMSAITLVSNLSPRPTLPLIAGAFLVMKTLEYSVRGVVNELLYVPLDFEARYVGKEVIGMLGYRLGKSGTSLFLSGLGLAMGLGGVGGAGLSVEKLTGMANGMAVMWLVAAGRLVRHVPDQRGAETKGKKKKKN